MTESWDVVVVGSGPNGLAAALTVAQAGHSVLVLEAADSIGGGLRSDVVAGLIRDRCAAVLPFAIGSPYLSTLDLESHGLEWAYSEAQFTQPLADGRVACSLRDLRATAERLGPDAARYEKVVEPLARGWDELSSDIQRPIARVPRHPLLLARYGVPGLRSSKAFIEGFETDEARALFAGCAAHSVLPLDSQLTAAFATLFAASAHAHGWPVVVGGSQRLADTMAAMLTDMGGQVRPGHRVDSLADLPDHKAVVFDLDPRQVAAICGDALPAGYRRRLQRFRFGAGIFKIDHVLDGPVPWADPWSGSSATVHVGGSFEETLEAEAEVASGRHPDKPFVLVAQQGVADPSRLDGQRQMLWSYTHVPSGSDIDRTDAVEAQIERFAPGFRDRVVARYTTTASQLEGYNPNLVGGDITGGSHGGLQLFIRPRLLQPYATPNASIYLASASTPPGGGVHGMGGHNAARTLLRKVFRQS